MDNSPTTVPPARTIVAALIHTTGEQLNTQLCASAPVHEVTTTRDRLVGQLEALSAIDNLRYVLNLNDEHGVVTIRDTWDRNLIVEVFHPTAAGRADAARITGQQNRLNAAEGRADITTTLDTQIGDLAELISLTDA